MFGRVPRSHARITIPRIPSSRLTAKDSKVSGKVMSNARSGIRNHRGLGAGAGPESMSLGYNIRRKTERDDSDDSIESRASPPVRAGVRGRTGGDARRS